MLMHNNGALAAALIIAGVSLPESFNVDDGAVERKAAEFGIQYPNLDKQAHLLLAEVEVAKDFRDAYFPLPVEERGDGEEMSAEQAEREQIAVQAEAELPPPPADPEGHEAGDIPAGVPEPDAVAMQDFSLEAGKTSEPAQ